MRPIAFTNPIQRLYAKAPASPVQFGQKTHILFYDDFRRVETDPSVIPVPIITTQNYFFPKSRGSIGIWSQQTDDEAALETALSKSGLVFETREELLSKAQIMDIVEGMEQQRPPASAE